MQKTRSSTTKATNTEPRIMPTIAPIDNPLSELDDPPLEFCADGAWDPEWVRLVADFPWGGGVYGGGGGAGPLSNEFPSYLFHSWKLS